MSYTQPICYRRDNRLVRRERRVHGELFGLKYGEF